MNKNESPQMKVKPQDCPLTLTLDDNGVFTHYLVNYGARSRGLLLNKEPQLPKR